MSGFEGHTPGDFYETPEHGWTCFHCGETFKLPGLARAHFGFDPASDPACRIKIGAERGLVFALRDAEEDAAKAWAAIHDETTDAAKAYGTMVARHIEQLRQVEEAGYERGIEDMRCERDEARAEAERLRACRNDLLAEIDRLCRMVQSGFREGHSAGYSVGCAKVARPDGHGDWLVSTTREALADARAAKATGEHP